MYKKKTKNLTQWFFPGELQGGCWICLQETFSNVWRHFCLSQWGGWWVDAKDTAKLYMGVTNQWPTGCMRPRMVMNVAQHKIIHWLQTLLSFITKFYYLDMQIFYISDHKLGTCLTILKHYWKGRCIIRVIMWGIFCLSMVASITKIMQGSFICSSVFVRVCMFNVWPKTTLLLPAWPSDAKRLDTPALPCTGHPPTTKNYLARNTNRTIAEKPGLTTTNNIYPVNAKLIQMSDLDASNRI